MTLVIPPGYGNAAFIFTSTFGTSPFVTTMGVDLSAFGGDFVNAANVIMTTYSSTIGVTTSSDLTLDRVNLAVGQDGPGGSVDSDIPPIQGGRAGTEQVIAMAPIARKVTNDIGRRGRGRMFLPGVITNTEVNESGFISTARRGTLQTAVDDFFDELFENSVDPNVSSPPVLLHATAPVDPTPITALSVAPQVGWIRGRIR